MKTDLLHVVPYYHPNAGGPPVVVQRLVEEMSHGSVASCVISTDACSPRDDTDWIGSLPFSDRTRIVRGSKLGEYAWQNRLAKIMHAAVLKARLVAIHGCWNWPNLCAMRACKRHSVPFVVMPHGMLDPNSVARGRWKKKLYGSLVEWPELRNAAAMVYTNEPERQLAQTTVDRLPKGEIATLGTDWPPDERESLAREFRAKYPQLEGKECVLFLGRLHPKKGLDLLIPAWKTIADAHPNACLIVAGSGSPSYESRMLSSIQSNEVSDSVVVTGMLHGRDKWGALASSSIFVLPSYQENFGLAVVESLASQTPVVISKRVNIWEPLASAGAASICELDSNSVADKVSFLLNNSEARSSMATAGVRCAKKSFDWKMTARSFESLLDRFGR